MAYSRVPTGAIQWELRNGISGTFAIENPSPDFVRVLVMALENGLPIEIPDVTVMPIMIITEITYGVGNDGPHRVEVWFREPDGQT